MRFIYESEARNRWEKGTLSELRFKTLKERNEEKRKRFIEVKQSPTWKNAMRNLGDRLKIEYANGGRESIRKAAEAHRRPVRCLDTGKLYSSITEAGLDIGVDKSMICKAVKNNYRVKGLKFEYC